MRTVKASEYDWTRETYEEQREGGRWNPALVLVWQGRRHRLGCGMLDDRHVFEESGRLYVLARNRPLGYVGLEVFEAGELVGETFLDSASGEQEEYINGLTAIYAAKRLADWIDY